MPEMNAIFSRGVPSAANAFFIWAKMEESPHQGHQRTSWSLPKSAALSTGNSVLIEMYLSYFENLIAIT